MLEKDDDYDVEEKDDEEHKKKEKREFINLQSVKLRSFKNTFTISECSVFRCESVFRPFTTQPSSLCTNVKRKRIRIIVIIIIIKKRRVEDHKNFI